MKDSYIKLTAASLSALLLSSVLYLAWSITSASISYRTEKYPEAFAAWQRLSAIFPGSAGLAFNSGVALYRQREYRKAAELFSRARGVNDRRVTAAARYNRGNCLVRLGDDLAVGDKAGAAAYYRQAVDEYERALAIDGVDNDAKFNLAAARNRLQAVRTAPPVRKGEKPGAAGRDKEADRTEHGRPQDNPARGNRDASERQPASSGNSGSSAQAAQDRPKSKNSAEPFTMSRKDAEALMREHRRTGGATALFRDSGRSVHSVEVLKDW